MSHIVWPIPPQLVNLDASLTDPANKMFVTLLLVKPQREKLCQGILVLELVNKPVVSPAAPIVNHRHWSGLDVVTVLTVAVWDSVFIIRIITGPVVMVAKGMASFVIPIPLARLTQPVTPAAFQETPVAVEVPHI